MGWLLIHWPTLGCFIVGSVQHGPLWMQIWMFEEM